MNSMSERTPLQELGFLEDQGEFIRRHIGPTEAEQRSSKMMTERHVVGRVPQRIPQRTDGIGTGRHRADLRYVDSRGADYSADGADRRNNLYGPAAGSDRDVEGEAAAGTTGIESSKRRRRNRQAAQTPCGRPSLRRRLPRAVRHAKTAEAKAFTDSRRTGTERSLS